MQSALLNLRGDKSKAMLNFNALWAGTKIGNLNKHVSPFIKDLRDNNLVKSASKYTINYFDV